MSNDLELLRTQYHTLFATTASGRIERENDPDRSPGPAFWLAGCAEGNIAGVRFDVPEEIAARILDLAATEPPFFTRDGFPKHLDRYADLLSTAPLRSRLGIGAESRLGIGARSRLGTGVRSRLGSATPDRDGCFRQIGLTYELPHDLKHDRGGVVLIDSQSHEARRFGVPAGLLEMGFRDASDFWEPWCAVLEGGQIASIAFAARLSETGAELGVATVPALRGRGYAKLAIAGWSRLQSLRPRALFYSTDRTNSTSLRVASGLGLRFTGASLRLSWREMPKSAERGII